MEKLIRGIAGKYSEYEIFSDFVALSAISVARAVRENERLAESYASIEKKYTDSELDVFAEMLLKLAKEMETNPRDVLGELYMRMNLGSKTSGQFFTSYELAKLTAKLSDYSELAEKGHTTLDECACGAGANIIAYVLEAKRRNLLWRNIRVRANDLDIKAVYMTYLQLSLLEIKAIVLQGDTLTQRFGLKLYTPSLMGI